MLKHIFIAILLYVGLGTAVAETLTSNTMSSSAGMTVADADEHEIRFVINNDEVYDKRLNLTWQRCSVGQKWVENSGCIGPIKRVNFEQAQKLANGEWRIPTKDELVTLIDKRYHNPAIRVDLFPDMDVTYLVYWTSNETNPLCAAAVFFGHGFAFTCIGRTALAYVRLVRNGP